MNFRMEIYTVYKNPTDYPEKIVVRKFIGIQSSIEPLCIEDTLEEARKKIPAGLFRMDRMENDDAAILETWF